MGNKLKSYAVLLGVGAVVGIAVAEMWRREVLHDSYSNYLPPPRDEAPAADTSRSEGRVRGVANRLWAPLASSANRDWMVVRRIRAGAARPPANAGETVSQIAPGQTERGVG